MSFRIRQDTESWFSEIEGKDPLRTKFDLYYLCLMAGFASGRYSELGPQDPPSSVFINDFTLDYRPSARLLIGLLLVSELSRNGIAPTERVSVRMKVRELVEPGGATLSDHGFKAMNAYASGGYEFLAESRDDKPHSPDEFLRSYAQLIQQALHT